MDQKKLKELVDDGLQNLIGYTEPAKSAYVLAMAKRATSSEQLLDALTQQGVPVGPSAHQFAVQLYSKIPRQGNGNKLSVGLNAKRNDEAAQQRERESVRLRLLNEQQTVLQRDPEMDGVFQGRDSSASQHGAKVRSKDERAKKDQKDQADKDKRSRRKYRKTKDSSRAHDEDDEQGTVGYVSSRKQRGWEADEQSSESEDETQREKRGQKAKDDARKADQKAREEFEQRLRQKDQDRTVNVMDKLTKQQEAEEARRQYATPEERDTLLKDLRVVSRQEYLAKREEKKVQELEDEIADEDRMFPDKALLSEKERADYEYKVETLRLAKQRLQLEEDADEEQYQMPVYYDDPANVQFDKREQALYGRYKEDKKSKDGNEPWSEQARWEDAQIRKAQQKSGAKDQGQAGEEDELQQFVFENEVSFVAGQAIAGTLDDIRSQKEEQLKLAKEAALQKQQNEREKMKRDRESLPVYPYREEFLNAVENFQVLVIVAETGAGKTTQLPQYLHEEGYTKLGKIGITQPRRVAAMSVAARVSAEMGTKIGREVGYSIRFEDCTSDRTVMKYMTDGMLLREFLSTPDLADYSVIMIDEAHERTLHTDVLFGLMKDIVKARPDLKLLISSATLDADKFSDFFEGAPQFKIPGRRFPVDIMYTVAPESNYIDAAVVTVLRIHLTQGPGDILVFLTGQEEIEACQQVLSERLKGKGSTIGELIVLPIYADLPPDLQAKIFEPTPPGARKVVLATNIAETSLTIDGVRYVIDPGFAKVNSYNPRTGMQSLLVSPVSKASANQRAGRAGRTSAGMCFRLFTAWSYENELEDNTPPEIQRTNIATVVLMLKSLNIDDLVNFDFMDPPPVETLMKSLEQLYALGALNDAGELTSLGRRMAEFPVDPPLAKVIIGSGEYGVSEDIASIVAMVSCGSAVFYAPKDKQITAEAAMHNFHRGDVGDHIALLQVYTQWEESGFSTQWCYENFVQVRSMKRARDIREQLIALMERVEIPLQSDPQNHDNIKKAITAGMFFNIAKLKRDGSYVTVKNPHTVFIHPSSGLAKVNPPPRWVLFHELMMTSKEFMRQVSEISPSWLVEIAPHYYGKQDVDESDMKKKRKHKGRQQLENAQ